MKALLKALVLTVTALSLFAGIAGCGSSNQAAIDEEAVAREKAVKDRQGIVQRTGGRWDLLTPEEKAHWLAPAGGNEARAKSSFEAEYGGSAGR